MFLKSFINFELVLPVKMIEKNNPPFCKCYFSGTFCLYLRKEKREKKEWKWKTKVRYIVYVCIVCLYPSSFFLSAHTSNSEYLANAPRERESTIPIP